MKYTKDFFSDVKQLADTIEEIGNPLLEDSKELVSLDSNLVSCKKALNKFKHKGEEQFEELRN